VNNPDDKFLASQPGEEQMKSSLSYSIVPVFFAGFLATTFLFGGIAAGGTAIGITAARVFAEPIVELFASVIGGAATILALTQSKK
jgi:hypothetical protein